MTARDTRDRPAAPSPSTGPPSFLRRHPILAAFGVLAGLSLFATYWPASAFVIGVVAGARATGIDGKAWREVKSLGGRLVWRLRKRHPVEAPPPSPAAPSPPAPQPQELSQDRSPAPSASLTVAAVRGRARRGAAVERPRPLRRSRPPAEVTGAGVRGPGD